MFALIFIIIALLSENNAAPSPTTVERQMLRAVRMEDDKRFYDLVKNEKADIHYKDDRAIIIASANGNDKLVDFLIKSGANVQAYDNLPLQQASLHGHIEVVKLLLAGGANPSALNGRAIKLASMGNHFDIVNLLIGEDTYGDKDILLADDDYME